MDDFAELEAQLAQIASWDPYKSSTPSSTSTSKPIGSTFQTQSSSSGSLSQSQISRLEKELELAKKNERESTQRANELQQKLDRFVLAVKEERALQARSYEEVEQRAIAAEERADGLEEKLVRLIEIVKRERQNKLAEAASPRNNTNASTVDNKLIEDERRKRIELERTIQEMSKQIGALEGELSNKEIQYQQEISLRDTLDNEINTLRRKLINMEENNRTSKNKYDQIDILNSQLNDKVNQLINEINKLKQQQQNDHVKSINVKSQQMNDNYINELEDKLRLTESQCRDYESKISKLVNAVKLERSNLKDKLQIAENRAIDAERKLLEISSKSQPSPRNHHPDVESLKNQILQLESKLRDSEKRARNMEQLYEESERKAQILSNQSTSSLSPSSPTPTPTPDVTSSYDDSSSIGGGGPPPPPPPPSLKAIDSTKITIKKSAGGATGGSQQQKSNPQNESLGNLINEIKMGNFKLKSVPKDSKGGSIGSSGSSSGGGGGGGVDLGALASEIVKERQKRIQQKSVPSASRTPRKSMALTNLLKELDGI